nr:MAG TPA: hypothetical protein [Inoviridae sp.]
MKFPITGILSCTLFHVINTCTYSLQSRGLCYILNMRSHYRRVIFRSYPRPERIEFLRSIPRPKRIEFLRSIPRPKRIEYKPLSQANVSVCSIIAHLVPKWNC